MSTVFKNTCHLLLVLLNFISSSKASKQSVSSRGFYSNQSFIFPINENTVGYVGKVWTWPNTTLELDARGQNILNISHIAEGTASLFLAKPLDREVQEYYNFSIFVMTNDIKNFSIANFTIKVLDINDNAPVFVTNDSSFVLECYGIGSVVTRVRATDQDSGLNGQIQYHIDVKWKHKFAINPQSGIITVNGEPTPSTPYEIKITAKDSGSPSLNSTKVIKIKPLHNQRNTVKQWTTKGTPISRILSGSSICSGNDPTPSVLRNLSIIKETEQRVITADRRNWNIEVNRLIKEAPGTPFCLVVKVKCESRESTLAINTTVVKTNESVKLIYVSLSPIGHFSPNSLEQLEVQFDRCVALSYIGSRGGSRASLSALDNKTVFIERRYFNDKESMMMNDTNIRECISRISLGNTSFQIIYHREVNVCQSHPCHNGGVCKSMANGNYVCNCTKRYTGINCAEVNVCPSHFCRNGGVCKTMANGSFVCNCTKGYKGKYCEAKIHSDESTIPPTYKTGSTTRRTTPKTPTDSRITPKTPTDSKTPTRSNAAPTTVTTITAVKPHIINENKSTSEIIAWVFGGLILIIIIVIVVHFCRRKLVQRREENVEMEMSQIDSSKTPWREIDKGCIATGKELGSGFFGVVLQGTVILDGQSKQCAVKMLKGHATEADNKDLINELYIISRIGYHPNIINLIGASTRTGPAFIVLEFASNGNLLDYLRANRDEVYTNMTTLRPDTKLDLRTRLKIAYEVVQGMRHLSSKKCVHRDLAARNILLDEYFVAKVTDFGLSRDVYEEGVYQINAQSKMPLKWMAIESLETMAFTTQSDVWSFGVLMWEIETAGATPYPGLMGREIFQELTSGHRLEQPPTCPDTLYELMSRCWIRDPSERPSFQQLCNELGLLLQEEAGYEDLFISPEPNESSEATTNL